MWKKLAENVLNSLQNYKAKDQKLKPSLSGFTCKIIVKMFRSLRNVRIPRVFSAGKTRGHKDKPQFNLKTNKFNSNQ